MARRILVLGATGMLGQPVTRYLKETGFEVRVLVRNIEKAHHLFDDKVDIVQGNAQSGEDIQKAIAGCDAAHINLPQDAELNAMKHVVDIGRNSGLERITYVSATTVCEENRWFEMIDIKMRAEAILRSSGIAYTVFCPTWAMETLLNLIRGDQAVVIFGKNPPALHFVAGMDLGCMVAASYQGERALGKRLFIHGPEGITLPDAVERFVNACYPEHKVMRLKLWQAKLIATLTRREELNSFVRLIDYFDKVGELGDPAEANALLGAPSVTLDEWFRMQKPTIKM